MDALICSICVDSKRSSPKTDYFLFHSLPSLQTHLDSSFQNTKLMVYAYTYWCSHEHFFGFHRRAAQIPISAYTGMYECVKDVPVFTEL